MSADYKSTLTLPQTKFPMRANLGEREGPRAEHWEKENLYQKLLEKNAKGSKFILHDGPPFTSGIPHTGTMTNRNLKDIILRYKAMTGHRTPFVPGWDCHGLPTELRALKEMKTNAQSLTPLERRKMCAEFSQKNIEIMRKDFQRLGLLADWSREYKTMAPYYEAAEMKALASFVEQGLVYRDLRPVIWSIPCKTALAEGEIDYHDHTSTAIWVAMPAVGASNTFFIIWTTTPWTIPSNLAVAMHPKFDYVELGYQGKKYILAAALVERFTAAVGWKGAIAGKPAKGQTFEGRRYKHPFMPHEGKVIMGESFVTAEDGVGIVHIAPGHGMDDYLAGKANGLEVYSPVDDSGCYVNDGRIPADLVGKTTFEKNGRSEANEAVIAKLQGSGHLLHSAPYAHQYPFCWRSNTPIIFRALEQWFIGLDRNNTRQKVLDAVERVNWIPAQGKNRIRGSIESRPDWCISRQRAWGLPVPAFKDAEGRRYIDAAVIRAVAEKVAQHGSDIFFGWSAEKLLEGVKLPAGWPSVKDLLPESDTIDVWLDSASSHLAVLKRYEDLAWPADLYLEGSDQHRGWFQSSLWMSVVAAGAPPYKNVLTHGFILDTDKEKLSKSKGALGVAEMIEKYGADVLRLWNASQDFTGDIILSEKILENISTTYMTLRNTLRYQLANLNGFDPSTMSLPVENMLPLDRWVLWQLCGLLEETTAAYEAYDFAKVYQTVLKFCQSTLSAVYHDAIKDRMYTCAPASLERRSAQTALSAVFESLVRVLAPLLPFTADEAWSYRQTDGDFAAGSVHLQSWPKALDDWKKCQKTGGEVDELLKLRGRVNEALEGLRKAKTIGKSLEAVVVFKGDCKLLNSYCESLPELYIVSGVELQEAPGELAVEARKADGHKCPRCWRSVSKSPDELCERCQNTLTALKNG